jgi:hypothetical protein
MTTRSFTTPRLEDRAPDPWQNAGDAGAPQPALQQPVAGNFVELGDACLYVLGV